MNKELRKIYLEDTPLAEAQKEFLSRVDFQRVKETVPTTKARGRVTAEPVFARVSMPNYHASAMDGIAVKAETTYGAHEQEPKQLKKDRDYVVVDTGDPIPPGFDAVIMIEHLHQIDDETVEIIEPASPWKHIRPIGEDVVVGEVIVPAGHQLRPVDLGALLAGGNVDVSVWAKPKVAVIPTGTELIPPSREVKRGEIIEFNGTVFSAYLEEWGAEPLYKGIVKDDYESIKEAIRKAADEADVVLINAGSSAGTEDFTVHVISELGEVVTHGVATRPGKPVILGLVKGKPVVGLPGYPVSAYLNLEWFVRPLIHKYLGLSEPERNRLKVKLGRRIVSSMGSEDFVRMNIGKVNGVNVANPLTRSAGVTMSMVRADGLLRIPSESTGYEQGDEVEVELYRPLRDIENTTVITGSHDLTVDLLSSFIRQKNPGLYITSSHVGSMGGILAVQKGECHAAGVHLFDAESGTYNIPFIEQHLRDREIVLINLVYREQGWMVKAGNPKQIHTLSDLTRDDVVFINRQRGSGTRLLLDYLLKQEGISRDEIYGYENEAVSHLSVAAAVAGGSADVGLGILSAANAMELEFISVGEERYDLILTRSFYESDAGKAFLEVVNSPQFKERVEQLGGYSCRDSGKILYQNF